MLNLIISNRELGPNLNALIVLSIRQTIISFIPSILMSPMQHVCAQSESGTSAINCILDLLISSMRKLPGHSETLSVHWSGQCKGENPAHLHPVMEMPLKMWQDVLLYNAAWLAGCSRSGKYYHPHSQLQFESPSLGSDHSTAALSVTKKIKDHCTVLALLGMSRLRIRASWL